MMTVMMMMMVMMVLVMMMLMMVMMMRMLNRPVVMVTIGFVAVSFFAFRIQSRLTAHAFAIHRFGVEMAADSVA